MFLHDLKYAMKTMVRNRTALIWTLMFPILLGTFMYMAFGKVYEESELFKDVPVAVVMEKENTGLRMLLDELSEPGDNKLLETVYVSDEEAQNALEDESVTAVIYVDDEISMQVRENSYENTLVQSILNEYKKQEKILTDIAGSNPEKVSEAVERLASSEEFYTEKKTSDGNQDYMTNYFYAIFAMSCLFASFAAAEKIIAMQADISALGIRRTVAPNSRLNSMAAEFISLLSFQLAVELVALLYFIMLGVDFGDKYPQILMILLVGSCIGIAMGMIVGTIPSISPDMKMSICVALSMALSVMADLSAAGIKDEIEHKIPILNRINPAVLITDSFYALNVFDTNERYLKNMVILGLMTAVLMTIAFFILRRNKYASV